MYMKDIMARQASMATWRNGSAFGFDCRRYQKVAGSSPAVVMFLSIQGKYQCFSSMYCVFLFGLSWRGWTFTTYGM